jgi:hypothetical protein
MRGLDQIQLRVATGVLRRLVARDPESVMLTCHFLEAPTPAYLRLTPRARGSAPARASGQSAAAR